MVAASHLAALLDGLYAADTPAGRRAEIQAELEAIRREGPQHWTDWIGSESDYVKFFALTVLSDVVAKGRWPDQPREHREKVKGFLFSTLRDRYPRAEHFVARKMVATLVAIAKVEWPAEWPDFLPAVHACFASPLTVALGLGFLLHISEEFVAAADLPSRRRDRLKADLLAVAPDILSQLLATLRQVLCGLEEQRSDDLCRIAVAAVGCLGSYLGWLPRDAIPPPSLTLLPALEACLAAAEPGVRAEALGVVYDVCSASYVSPGSPSAVLFEGCVQLLSAQLQSFAQLSPKLRADEAYVQRLALCTAAVFAAHVPRLQAEPGGGARLAALLQAALGFTAAQCTLAGYEEALTLWPPFVSWLEDQKANCAGRHYAGAADMGANALETFRPLGLALLNLLLDRALVGPLAPADALREARRALDMPPLASRNEEPAEGTFARHAGPALALLGRLASVYRDAALVAPQPAGPGLGLLGHRLAAVLQGWAAASRDQSLWAQDAETLLAVFCNVSYEAEQHFDLLFPMASSVLGTAFSFGTHLLTVAGDGADLAHRRCAAQCLHVLLAYSHWLCQFQERAVEGPPGRDPAAFRAAVEQVVQLSLLPLELARTAPVDPAILVTAAQLFAEVCAFVPAAALLRLPAVVALVNPQIGSSLYLHTLHAQRRNVPEEVWVELFKAAAFVLLGPIPAQEQESHATQDTILGLFLSDLQRLLEALLGPLQESSGLQQPPSSALQQRYATAEAQAMVDHALGVLSGLLGGVACASHAVRLALHRHLQPFYPLLAALCQHVLLLRLWAAPFKGVFTVILALFKHLKKFLAREFIQSTVSIFLTFVLEAPGGLDSPAFETLLQLLEVLVNTGLPNEYVEHVVGVVQEKVVPVIQEQLKADALQAFGQLVHTLLLRNWAYFWLPSQGSEPHRPTGPGAATQWAVLLGAVLRPLRWQDLLPFHSALRVLLELDTTHGLARRVLTPVEHGDLTAVLVQVLVQRSHQLYAEAVLDALNRLCNAHPERFYTEHLPTLLHRTSALTAPQKEALAGNLLQCWAALQRPARVDPLTFATHLTEFTRDFAVFLDTNAP